MLPCEIVTDSAWYFTYVFGKKSLGNGDLRRHVDGARICVSSAALAEEQIWLLLDCYGYAAGDGRRNAILAASQLSGRENRLCLLTRCVRM
ncbi:hypothetical protein AMD24_00074 [Candidatus Xiphinematobacter sp. Idaho Grape]|nr:hypothetical protein AMD24_00074 [Candidatus Xiphinematobacter sp. Idaho Grape]